MQRLKASESGPVRRSSLPIECGTLTFNGEDAEVVDARFVNEVVRVCEFVRGGDLVRVDVEEGSMHTVGRLTSSRAFRSSLKHRVKTLSGGEADADVAPAGLRRGKDG